MGQSATEKAHDTNEFKIIRREMTVIVAANVGEMGTQAEVFRNESTKRKQHRWLL